MRKFLLFACIGLFASYATARPDLSHGYSYNQGHSSGGGTFLDAPLTSTSFAPSASGSSYFNAAPAIGQTSFVGSSSSGGGSYSSGSSGGYTGGFSAGSSGGYSGGASSGSVNYAEQQAFLSHLHQHQAPIISKHFYLHTAPAEHDEQQIVRYVNVGRPRKNYNVVFIDTPSSTASKAKIIANLAPVEDKTAIYVLSKKTNALDVSAEVVTEAPLHHKPEVFYIKYKTPEEAVHAQHTIQAQYDSLGGSSDLVNEGTIQSSSVIGSLGGGGGGGGSSYSDTSSENCCGGAGVVAYDGAQSQDTGSAVTITHTGDNTQQTYLPSHHK